VRWFIKNKLDSLESQYLWIAIRGEDEQDTDKGNADGLESQVAGLRAEVGNLRTHLASVARDIKELRTGGA
jgi:hypothetical protein